MATPKKGVAIELSPTSPSNTLKSRSEASSPNSRGDSPNPPMENIREVYDVPFDIFIVNLKRDYIWFCGRIADPSPSIDYNAELLAKEKREKQTCSCVVL